MSPGKNFVWTWDVSISSRISSEIFGRERRTRYGTRNNKSSFYLLTLCTWIPDTHYYFHLCRWSRDFLITDFWIHTVDLILLSWRVSPRLEMKWCSVRWWFHELVLSSSCIAKSFLSPFTYVPLRYPSVSSFCDFQVLFFEMCFLICTTPDMDISSTCIDDMRRDDETKKQDINKMKRFPFRLTISFLLINEIKIVDLWNNKKRRKTMIAVMMKKNCEWTKSFIICPMNGCLSSLSSLWSRNN